eukprot:1021274-Pelagomonas_calceolata.AAC.1
MATSRALGLGLLALIALSGLQMPSVTSRATPFAVHCYIGSEAECPPDHSCYTCFGVHHHIGHGFQS